MNELEKITRNDNDLSVTINLKTAPEPLKNESNDDRLFSK